MKNIILVITLLLTVSSCGTTHKMAKVAGVYQSVYFPGSGRNDLNNGLIVILNKDGTLLDIEYDGRFTGTWKFTKKNIIELKHIPSSIKKTWIPYTSTPDYLDQEAEIINRDSIRIGGIPFVRIK